jgi:hypothetical protein
MPQVLDTEIAIFKHLHSQPSHALHFTSSSCTVCALLLDFNSTHIKQMYLIQGSALYLVKSCKAGRAASGRRLIKQLCPAKQISFKLGAA